MKRYFLLVISTILILIIAGCESTSPTSTAIKSNSITMTPTPTITGEISIANNFYIIADGSGSMSESTNAGNFKSKAEGTKWALTKFVNEVVPIDANLGLFVFDTNGANERVSLGQNNRNNILTGIKNLSAGGGTPLNAAIRYASDVLIKQRQKQLEYGNYYMIIVTDGMATDESSNDAKTGANYAVSNRISMITIGFGLKSDHPLAKYSLSYRNANDPVTLFQALKETQGESSYFDATNFNK